LLHVCALTMEQRLAFGKNITGRCCTFLCCVVPYGTGSTSLGGDGCCEDNRQQAKLGVFL
jgi:hypothetical protein